VSSGQTDYDEIKALFDAGRFDDRTLGERLSNEWASSYRARARPGNDPELVEVDQRELRYLFDVTLARVVGVYGKSAPTSAARPGARMREFPLPPDTPAVIRGHLVAHSIGGGTDINLIPQNARLNLSAGWRRLERLAQAHPGCFISVEARYEDLSQTPTASWLLHIGRGALRRPQPDADGTGLPRRRERDTDVRTLLEPLTAHALYELPALRPVASTNDVGGVSRFSPLSRAFALQSTIETRANADAQRGGPFI
jgi:hypothetical protein